MSKRTKRLKIYSNGTIYEGWMERGRRTYLGKLYLTEEKTCYYYGIWSNNLLKRGQYEDTQMKFKIYLVNRKTFDAIKIDTCAICLDLMGSDKYICFQCTHIFCLECIKAWLIKNHNCPLCRDKIILDFLADILNKNNLYFV